MNVTEKIADDDMRQYLEGCRRQDLRSQKAVYTIFFPYAKQTCVRLIKDEHECLEVINDGFLKILTKIDLFEPGEKDLFFLFLAWFKKILTNTAIDHLRRKKRRFLMTNQPFELEKIPVTENIHAKISATEISHMATKISPACQTIFHLHVNEGLNHRQIANLLSIAVGTSKSNLSKARRQLKTLWNLEAC